MLSEFNNPIFVSFLLYFVPSPPPFILSPPFIMNLRVRIIEAQIVQKLKNNEAWPKVTGAYEKQACTMRISVSNVLLKHSC